MRVREREREREKRKGKRKKEGGEGGREAENMRERERARERERGRKRGRERKRERQRGGGMVHTTDMLKDLRRVRSQRVNAARVTRPACTQNRGPRKGQEREMEQRRTWPHAGSLKAITARRIYPGHVTCPPAPDRGAAVEEVGSMAPCRHAHSAAVCRHGVQGEPNVDAWAVGIERRGPEEGVVDVPVAPCFPWVVHVALEDEDGILRHMQVLLAAGHKRGELRHGLHDRGVLSDLQPYGVLLPGIEGKSVVLGALQITLKSRRPRAIEQAAAKDGPKNQEALAVELVDLRRVTRILAQGKIPHRHIAVRPCGAATHAAPTSADLHRRERASDDTFLFAPHQLIPLCRLLGCQTPRARPPGPLQIPQRRRARRYKGSAVCRPRPDAHSHEGRR